MDHSSMPHRLSTEALVIGLACFVAGSLFTLVVLGVNTQQIASRHCDDIIYYPNKDLVCEVKLSHPSDVVNVIVKE